MNKKISLLAKFSLVLTVLSMISFGAATIYSSTFSEGYLLYYKRTSSVIFAVQIVGLICGVIGFITAITGIVVQNKNNSGKRICVSCTVIYLVFFLYLCTPTNCRFREKYKRISCASNLKQIGLALQQYAEDYAGFYPPENGAAGLEVLRKNDYLTDYGIYICPSTTTTKGKDGQPLTEDNMDYIYIGGLKSTSDPNLPLAYDKAKNHEYYGNILFANGTVKGFTGNPWTEKIKERE
ncbi:MAG: DUF1559 domain-containing protein [Victivallaceae bacterium]